MYFLLSQVGLMVKWKPSSNPFVRILHFYLFLIIQRCFEGISVSKCWIKSLLAFLHEHNLSSLHSANISELWLEFYLRYCNELLARAGFSLHCLVLLGVRWQCCKFSVIFLYNNITVKRICCIISSISPHP